MTKQASDLFIVDNSDSDWKVWKFHIGGYQVCQKWLKDRKGRELTTDDIAHYQRIVVALSETIRLMARSTALSTPTAAGPAHFNLPMPKKVPPE